MSVFRQYTTLPNLPAPGLLERYMDTLCLIVPVARTNEVLNPSVETNTTGWNNGAGSIARTTTQQYHGAYSIIYTPSAAVNDGPFYSPITTTTGQTRAIQCKFLGFPGVPYKFSIATTGGVDLVATTFIGTGYWQWVWLFHTETASNTRRIYFTKNNSASVASFYIDGLDSQVCGSEGVFVTTYIDGDQLGYVTPQVPPAYLWSGTPHASTSSRSGQTRAGGRVVRLKDFGFFLSTIIGLGLASPRNEALAFGQLDGAQYQDTIKPTRSVSFVGRWGDYTPTAMEVGAARLARQLDRDRLATRQPAALCLQARYCNQDIGEFITIPRAIYASGLEGVSQELPTEAGNITFSQYFPYVTGRDGGAALTVQSALTINGIAQRAAATGQWAAMSTGMTGGTGVQALIYGLNGTLFAAGSFTDAGGSGADNIAQWNGTAWSILGSATALNSDVSTSQGLAISNTGVLYVCGNFTNVNGIAAADFIASWDGTNWAALSTGANAAVRAITFAPDGTLYAGGNFTTIGGSAFVRIAKWNGAAWAAVGTGVGANGGVSALAVAQNGDLYIGGSFTTVDGVAATGLAKWNGTAWSAVGDPSGGAVTALTFGPNQILYAGGAFTSIGGVAVGRIAAYNGTSWAPLGSGVNNTVSTIVVDAKGGLYAAGVFTTAGGVATPDGLAYWNGSAWTSMDVDASGASNALTVLLAPDGTMTFGVGTTGASTAAGITTVTNNGSAETPPTLIIRGPSSGSSRIYQLLNITTGQAIYLNYTILAGETATLVLDPKNLSFTSTFRGNIYNTILPGSQATQFVLQPGANTISFFAADSTVTAVLTWQTRYLMLEDALYGAVEP